MSRCTQEPLEEDCIFTYRAITLYRRPFQTVQLTLSYLRLLLSHLPVSPFGSTSLRESNCGPTTPSSPFESLGLGCSEFARHYYRNLC